MGRPGRALPRRRGVPPVPASAGAGAGGEGSGRFSPAALAAPPSGVDGSRARGGGKGGEVPRWPSAARAGPRLPERGPARPGGPLLFVFPPPPPPRGWGPLPAAGRRPRPAVVSVVAGSLRSNVAPGARALGPRGGAGAGVRPRARGWAAAAGSCCSFGGLLLVLRNRSGRGSGHAWGGGREEPRARAGAAALVRRHPEERNAACLPGRQVLA